MWGEPQGRSFQKTAPLLSRLGFVLGLSEPRQFWSGLLKGRPGGRPTRPSSCILSGAYRIIDLDTLKESKQIHGRR